MKQGKLHPRLAATGLLNRKALTDLINAKEMLEKEGLQKEQLSMAVGLLYFLRTGDRVDVSIKDALRTHTDLADQFYANTRKCAQEFISHLDAFINAVLEKEGIEPSKRKKYRDY
jgi:hypothetical protein